MATQLLRLIPAQVFLHATMAGTRLAVPLLALQQGYGAAAVGLLLALFALSQVFLALPAGRYADRHGLKAPMLIAVVVAGVGTAAAAVFPHFAVMCLAALATGAGTGITTIALQRHVGRTATDAHQLKQVFSWLSVAPAIANFVGPFAAGLLIDHAGGVAGGLFNYRITFAVMALLPVVCWLFVRGAQEELPQAAPAAPSGPKPSALDLLRSPMFRRLLFVNWLQSSSWDVHSFVIPLLGHERGLSASAIGTILAAFAVAATAVRIFLPLVAAKATERDVITVSTVATALLFCIYPLLDSPVAMGLCSVLLGFALGAVQPMIMSMLHQITPHTRHGEALGLRVMVVNASSVAVPVVFGALGTVIGIAGVFWIIGAVVGMGSPAVRGLQADAGGHAPPA
ncbi:MAG: MFS transporter [Pseudomonadota bacterium]